MLHNKFNHSIGRYFLIFEAVLILIFTRCSTPQTNNRENNVFVSNTPVIEADSVTIIPLTTTSTKVALTPLSTASVTLISSETPAAISSPTTATIPASTPPTLPTLTPTLTPLPTISAQQRGQIYADLLSSNRNCELPCWWGFELGDTTLDEIQQFYGTFDVSFSEWAENDENIIFTVLFEDSQIENGTQVRHIFRVQNGIVLEAEIEIVFDQNYQIQSLLPRLGQPSEVWMWTVSESYEGILPVRFRAFFPQSGVFIVFSTGAVKIDETIRVCFDKREGAIILLWRPTIWDPNGSKGIMDRASESINAAFALEGFPIQEVSNWDTAQFYTILTDTTHSECLETPSTLWSPP